MMMKKMDMEDNKDKEYNVQTSDFTFLYKL